MSDPIEHFRLTIAAAGFEVPDNINPDGAIHRFSTNGKRGDDSGWYVLHTDGIPAGAFGCWREGITQIWCAKSDNAMTDDECRAHRQRIKAMKGQREANLLATQRQASQTAAALWQQAIPVPAAHDYLTRKGVECFGVRFDGRRLIIPMRDTACKLHSLQTITPEGDKRFHPGGRVKGCYHAIGGKPDGVLVIAEGYATGANIHEATGWPVAVSFNAGNIEPVAVSLRKAYADLVLVIAADDDHLSPGNPGLTAAKQAALAVGGIVVVPQFPAHRPVKATDFNDMAVLAGLSAVRACFFEIEVLSC